MAEILALVGLKFPKRTPPRSSQHIDDVIDRLHRGTTTLILVVLAIIITTQQYVGSSIDCWVPAHFTDKQLAYTNDFCWIQNTYYLPEHADMPRSDEERVRITYYQWVAIILLVEAAMFYSPFLLWMAINDHVGIDLKHLVGMGQKLLVTEMSVFRDETLAIMSELMDR